jgi:diguanylate cyclase
MIFRGTIVEKILAWVFPYVPDVIRPALQQTQSNDINRHVPMLMAVACMNVIIIMAVCAHRGYPFYSYAWMIALILYCAIRIAVRVRSARSLPASTVNVPRNVTMSVVIMAILGLDASYTFAVGTFDQEILIPVSLVLGAMAIAHCLYAIRQIALPVLITGIFPVSITMVAYGDFRATMLGFSFLSVAMLMIRFVAAQSDQLIENLLLQHQIREMADTDVLTGLSNRRAIMEKLERLESEGSAFGIALIDLDGFKQINDSLGHQAGDVLLQNVASRLSAGAGQNDLAGRLGGDEFIVILPDAHNDAAIAACTTAILAELCRPITLDNRNLPIGASLGAAIFPHDGSKLDALLKHADEMLYAAKRSGRETKVSRKAA